MIKPIDQMSEARVDMPQGERPGGSAEAISGAVYGEWGVEGKCAPTDLHQDIGLNEALRPQSRFVGSEHPTLYENRLIL